MQTNNICVCACVCAIYYQIVMSHGRYCARPLWGVVWQKLSAGDRYAFHPTPIQLDFPLVVTVIAASVCVCGRQANVKIGNMRVHTSETDS